MICPLPLPVFENNTPKHRCKYRSVANREAVVNYCLSEDAFCFLHVFVVRV